MVDTRQTGLTRQMLGKFLSDPQTIKAFENLAANTDDLAIVLSAIQQASVLVLSPADTFENERLLEFDGNIIGTDGGAGGSLTLGLSATGVDAGSYGSQAQVIQISVSEEGRVNLAQAFDLNTDNIIEGAANLFYTDSRARAALSEGVGIDYDALTGVIAVTPTLAAYAGGDTPSPFFVGIVDSVDAAAFRAAIGAGTGGGDVPSSRLVSTGAGLVGGGNLSMDRTLSLATSGVTAGSYGSAIKVPTITVDTYGRVTIASENTIPALASGKNFMPTLTAIANVSSLSAYNCQWSRIGDTVFFSGRVDMTATAGATLSRFTMTLPVATTMTAGEHAGGNIGTGFGGAAQTGIGIGNGTTIEVQIQAIAAAARAHWFLFHYQVI